MFCHEITLLLSEGSSIRREFISAEETMSYGFALGTCIPPKTPVFLFGDLGSGKTTLIKGIIEGYTGVAGEEVSSPTFVTLNIYQNEIDTSKTVYHFDLYRLKDYKDFAAQGFADLLEMPGSICCIEWSERLGKCLPGNRLEIYMNHLFPEENKREIRVLPFSS